jgi:hypothetical protein
VDKTASFVARNGPEFEQRIKQNELNNPKFTFLNSGDPYNAYYEHKVEEIREGKDVTPPPVAEVPKKVKYFFFGITIRDLYFEKNQKLYQNQSSKWRNFAKAKYWHLF